MLELDKWYKNEGIEPHPDYYVEVQLNDGVYLRGMAVDYNWNLEESTLLPKDRIIKAFRLIDKERVIPDGYIDAVPLAPEEEPEQDNVNNPKHYQLLPGVEVIDVRDSILDKLPAKIDYKDVDCWSRSWEYLTRMWSKNGLEDAKKARWYLDRLIKQMESR